MSTPLNQLGLDFSAPRSRRSDPNSSRRAEDRMRCTGALRGQMQTCLEMVRANPGLSSKQLGAIGPLDRYQVARRLADLLKARLVRRVESGDSDCLWWVNEAGQQ